MSQKIRCRCRSAVVVGMVLLFGMGGCTLVQVGRNFDLQTFGTMVEQGVTTKAEVRSWLGEPSGTGIDVDTSGQRYEQWTYYFGSGKLPKMKDAVFKILQIKFDQGGVVQAFSWSGES